MFFADVTSAGTSPVAASTGRWPFRPFHLQLYRFLQDLHVMPLNFDLGVFWVCFFQPLLGPQEEEVVCLLFSHPHS